MKYLKYCEHPTIGSSNVNYEAHVIGKIEGQPKQGPTVICFKNPNTEETRVVYTGKNIFSEDESPIQYTWRYEYYNGHPAIIVNFSRIDPGYKENIVCLESNNMARGGTELFSIGYNKIKNKNNNRALNVLRDRGGYVELIPKNKTITWYRLGDLQLNTDYPIYITVPDRYITKALKMGINYNVRDDWEVRINLRPTIRGSLSEKRPTISICHLFRHTPNIPVKEYMTVKFPYRDIFQL